MQVTTIGPAIILVLSAIGALRVLTVAYRASKRILRAVGHALVRITTSQPRLTQADVDAAIAAALASRESTAEPTTHSRQQTKRGKEITN